MDKLMTGKYPPTNPLCTSASAEVYRNDTAKTTLVNAASITHDDDAAMIDHAPEQPDSFAICSDTQSVSKHASVLLNASTA